MAGQTGLFAYVNNYLEAQRRTPHALNSMQNLPGGLAADAAYNGAQRSKLPQQIVDQLRADKLHQVTGETQDRRHVKTLDDNRTETAKTYLNADGSRTQVISTQATSYKDGGGKWQDVDMTLVKDSAGKWHSKANAWQVSFGQSSEGVQLTKGGQLFTLVPVGGTTVSPVVTGSAPDQVVTYKNVWPSVDLQYKVSGSQVKESIVLNNSNVATGFAFAYSGANLSAKDNHAGTYELDGAFAGFQIAAPSVTTQSGGPISAPVQQTLNGSTIDVSLDQNWLASQKPSAFPVVIDPTVVNVGANYQNMTSTGLFCLPGGGCGNSVGHDTANNWDWRFQYGVTIPTGGTNQVIANAVLHLDMGTSPVGITGPEQITVDHANCSTYNCFDLAYGEATGTATTTADIDLAGLYRAAVLNSDTTPWFTVRGEEGGTVDKYKMFDDTKTTVTFTYETLPNQSLIDSSNPNISVPADSGTSVTTQPTLASLSTAATDPDGPGPQRYRYIVASTKSIPATNPLNMLPSVTGVVADSSTLDSPQWVVPDNVLQDGNTYYWQALVWDGYNTTPAPWVYSPVYSFKVDLRNGKDATQAFDSSGPVSVDFATGNVTTSASSHTMDALGGTIGLGLDYNSPLRSRPGLVGDYYNDPLQTRTFPSSSIAPTLTRVDPNVNFAWGASSPSTGVVSTDNFLTRWSGWFVAPATATYQFGTTSDDGSRVYVTNMTTPYVDSWSAGTTNNYGTGIALTAGQLVQIKYEYAEWTGSATAQMLVKTTDGVTVTPRVIPTIWLQTGPRSIATPHGLVGRYYTDPGAAHTFPTDLNDPTRLFLTRTDASLNQNWGAGSPVPGGPTDNFMAEWTGQFRVPLTDTYTFGVGSDDGARVYINGTLVTDAWSDHNASPIRYGSSNSYSQGDLLNIKVDYYENTGSAQMGLYVREVTLGTADIPVDSTWLNPQAQILPDGWGLALDGDGSVSYSYVSINSGGVTLYDSTGQTHEYKYVNGGFTPPINESGQMVRNGDGTITLQDSDGQTYVFSSNGTIVSVTQPADDRAPAALQYTYGSTGGSVPRLTQIADGVNSTRKLSIYYGGDANCPAAPSGFLAANATSFICGATSSDGRTAGFFYVNGTTGPQLGRIALPGNDLTDYQYLSGLLSSVRSSLANDAIAAGVRSQDSTELTAPTYDGLGRASSVTMPAATAGAVRLAHTYDYLTGSATQMHVVNATEPNGFNRKVTYDGTYRTLTDTDVANLTTTTVWDSVKDLVKSTTDPAGLKTTILYDYADRPTDTYGPAPAAWFDANGVPLTTPTNYTPQVPHSQNVYEENINGLAAAYHEVNTAVNGTGATTKVLFGSPKLHGTGVGVANGDILKTWGGTPPITPASGNGWGVSLTGWIHLATNGSYAFRTHSDDGARLWVGDTLLTDDWTDGALRNHPNNTTANGIFVNTAGDKWYHVRLDYYNKSVGSVLDTDAQLELYMTPPGGGETSALGSLLKPNYGLVTTSKEFDSSASVGDTVTTNNYGTNPELGLLQSSTVDPTGLNLTTTNMYEAQGASGGFLRQLSSALPGGATTNYAYYTATDVKDNPCTTGTVESYPQAGMLRLKTEPDPDGAGSQTPITTESIYDDSGRVVATRFNTESSWTCLTYDSRSRLTQKVIPANANGSARTVVYDYAVGGNPLVSSTNENGGGVELATTIDLLGRTTSYQDQNNSAATPTVTTYDNIGRLISRSGKMGLEEFTYDNLNRLTGQKLDSIVLAVPTYDAFGRLQQVTYPRASLQKQVINRDTLGRVNGYDYTLGNGTTHETDAVTLSQSGQVVSGTELTKAKSYTYDKVGRLTNATLGTNTYGYSYATPSGATCNQSSANLNANKDSNRTSQTVNGATTTYCYDNADRLIASSDPGLTTPIYDTHGNSSSIGQSLNAKYLAFNYDSSDRTTQINQVFGTNYTSQYSYDPQDRLTTRTENKAGTLQWASYYGYTTSNDTPDYEMDNTFTVRERYLHLPGGVLFTIRSSASSFSSISNVYSLPNIHGDIMATTKGSGAIQDTFTYEPFGKITSTALPDNTNGKADYDSLGQYQKQTETNFTNQPQLMGARIYMSVMGRFTQVDPVQGGNANNYAYPTDPVNDEDISGMIGWKRWFTDRYNNVNSVVAKTQKVGQKITSWCGGSSLRGAGCNVGFALVTRGRSKGGGGKFGEGFGNLQMKRISSGEIDALKKAGYDPEGLKRGYSPKNSSKYDIFKDGQQNLYIKPKSGIGPGDPLNINMKDVW
ncbi:MAG TPA: PA14 domain-containing protein [Patescibacteria group bacterium]|nr:PA14 domain-containing protein [Patescibacteria group bacterium]